MGGFGERAWDKGVAEFAFRVGVVGKGGRDSRSGADDALESGVEGRGGFVEAAAAATGAGKGIMSSLRYPPYSALGEITSFSFSAPLKALNVLNGTSSSSSTPAMIVAAQSATLPNLGPTDIRFRYVASGICLFAKLSLLCGGGGVRVARKSS